MNVKETMNELRRISQVTYMPADNEANHKVFATALLHILTKVYGLDNK